MSWTSVPPRRDVQDLGAAADREQRHIGRQRPTRAGRSRTRRARAPRRRRTRVALPVEHRVDVAATREEEAVEIADQPARTLADFEDACPGACPLHRGHVVVELAAACEPITGIMIASSFRQASCQLPLRASCFALSVDPSRVGPASKSWKPKPEAGSWKLAAHIFAGTAQPISSSAFVSCER